MIRGSTPTHEFNIPFDTKYITALEIVYAQSDEVLFTKTLSDCTLSANTISLTLTQEDTFKFDCYKRVVQIQIRIKTDSDKVVVSDLITVDLAKCLFDEVI